MHYLFRIVLGMLLLTGSASMSANAQLEIELKTPRTRFLPYEPAKVYVEITNISGSAVQLMNFTRGNSNSSWLKFELRPQSSKSLRRYENARVDNVSISSGGTIVQEVELNRVFDLSAEGHYQLKAYVLYESGDKSEFTSLDQQIEIRKGEVIWEQRAGLGDHAPESPNSSPSSRETFLKYSLVVASPLNRLTLYSWISDEKNNTHRRCLPLGLIMQKNVPEKMIDGKKNLHVLHQETPQVFVYTGLSPQGEVLRKTYYLNRPDQPHLIVKDDQVLVVGGEVFDPNNPPTITVTVPTLQAQKVEKEQSGSSFWKKRKILSKKNNDISSSK